MKKHNFFAGPSILSEYTIKNTADAILNFANTGLSILEVSHRGKEFVAVMDEAQQLVKELLDVPEGYHVLYLGGGASLQFCMAPFNLLRTKAGYLDTGTWASNAIKEARLFGEVEVLASSKEANYTYYPKGYTVPDDLDYFHITTNNTIYGTELRTDPDVKVPLVADMSSDIFSRPIDVAKYDLIYAGAQKNLGPAGALRRGRCSTLLPCFPFSPRFRLCAIIRRWVALRRWKNVTSLRRPFSMRLSMPQRCL